MPTIGNDAESPPAADDPYTGCGWVCKKEREGKSTCVLYYHKQSKAYGRYIRRLQPQQCA